MLYDFILCYIHFSSHIHSLFWPYLRHQPVVSAEASIVVATHRWRHCRGWSLGLNVSFEEGGRNSMEQLQQLILDVFYIFVSLSFIICLMICLMIVDDSWWSWWFLDSKMRLRMIRGPDQPAFSVERNVGLTVPLLQSSSIYQNVKPRHLGDSNLRFQMTRRLGRSVVIDAWTIHELEMESLSSRVHSQDLPMWDPKTLAILNKTD